MPAIRIDWQQIRDETEANGFDVNNPFVFVLPHGGRHLLMSVIDVLKWKATYRTDGYDYSDWDSLLAMVELTHLGLMEGEIVGEISDAIRYLADKLADNFPEVGTNIVFPESGTGTGTGEDMSTTTVNVNCGCGCGGTGTGTGTGVDYTIPPPVDVPENPPINTLPPGNQSNAQKCSMSNYLVYVLRLTLLKVKENGGDFISFTAWANTLFSSPVDFAYALTYQTWQWCKQVFTGNDIDVSDVFDEFVNEYVCNLFSSTSQQNAYESMQATLYETLIAFPDLSYTARLIASELPYDLLFMSDGEIQIPAGFENRQCCGQSQDGLTQIPEPEPNAGKHYVWYVPPSGQVVFSSPNKTAGLYDGLGLITVSSISESSYDHGIAYVANGSTANGVLVASEIETITYHTTLQWGASQIGSYAGHSSDGCIADRLQRRIQIRTGDWAANGYLRKWCEDVYGIDQLDTQINSLGQAGWPGWTQPAAVPLKFRIRYLYEVPD